MAADKAMTEIDMEHTLYNKPSSLMVDSSGLNLHSPWHDRKPSVFHTLEMASLVVVVHMGFETLPLLCTNDCTCRCIV